MNYEQQIVKAEQDLSRLVAVLQNIHEHNKFLAGQYEAYKEYLDNVRQTCTTSAK
jgi:regulator of replication initiation timing